MAYSVGHFFNDLTAVLWFMYLPYYLTKVCEIDESVVAACSLAGQAADGIATTFVGIVSDKLNPPCGKRAPWYLFGTLIVAPCFLGIFIYPRFVE
jgi:Na+/melibiose symporter-like transporter